MKTSSFILILSFCITNLMAQNDCYTNLRQAGIDHYNSGKYDDAISAWNSSKSSEAKGCQPPPNHDLNSWIAKANDAKKCQTKRNEGENAYITKDYDKAIGLWQEIINANCVNVNIDSLKKQIEQANKAKNCDKLQADGQVFFNNRQYEKAIRVWRDALACTSLSEIKKTEIKNLIKKSEDEIQKREKAQKLSATRIKAQRAAAEKNYDLAISIWNECRQYTSNTAEQKEINDNIKLIEETRPFTFIVRAIRIYCENIDDGIEGRSITDPGGHTDRDAEIYGQVSMRVEGTNFNNNSSDIVPFWRILKENKQPMSQGKTYQLNQQLNRTVTIKGVSALKAARFILIGNGTNNELRNGIIDDDGSNDDPERMEASPFTLKEKFIDIKAKGKMRFNHKFTTGTGKNEVIFTYEIEYWK